MVEQGEHRYMPIPEDVSIAQAAKRHEINTQSSSFSPESLKKNRIRGKDDTKQLNFKFLNKKSKYKIP